MHWVTKVALPRRWFARAAPNLHIPHAQGTAQVNQRLTHRDLGISLGTGNPIHMHSIYGQRGPQVPHQRFGVSNHWIILAHGWTSPAAQTPPCWHHPLAGTTLSKFRFTFLHPFFMVFLIYPADTLGFWPTPVVGWRHIPGLQEPTLRFAVPPPVGPVPSCDGTSTFHRGSEGKVTPSPPEK
jgi:hypothetical protein